MVVVVPSFVASLAAVYCGMHVAKSLGGPAASAIVGVILATIPTNIISASRVLPDAFLDFALWGSLALVVSAAAHRWRLGFFLAGLLGGYAYIVRSYGLLLAPLGVLPLLGPRGERVTRFIWFLLGLAVVPCGEMIFHGVATGTPFWTMQIQQISYTNYPSYLDNSLLYYPRILLFPPRYGFNLGRLSTLLLLCLPVVKWNRMAKVGAFIGLVWFVYLEFGFVTWSPLTLVNKHPRYLSVLALPMALVISAGVDGLLSSRRQLVRWCVRPAILGTAVWFTFSGVRGAVREAAEARSNLTTYRTIADAIVGAQPPSVAFPHWRWPLRLNYLTGYAPQYWCGQDGRNDCRFRVPGEAEQPRAGEWVIVAPTDPDWPPNGASLPRWMTALPPSWPVVRIVDDVRILQVPDRLLGDELEKIGR